MPADLDFDARAEHDRLHTFYDATEALLDRPDALLFGTVPSVSGWSPAQHLDHIWLANGRSLTAASLAAQGRRTTEGGTINDAGRQLLAAGTLPRGQMAAPESVTPPHSIDRKHLKKTLARSRKALGKVDAVMDALPDATGRIEHPRLGALTPPQWLRFVRIHSDHHRAIVQDILDAA
jgi:hypothetical protein